MNSSDPIASKLARLERVPDARVRVLDLFSGCGGLSLGFKAAGFQIVAAMETDPLAALSHANNFFKGQSAEVISHHARPRDVAVVTPDELAEEFNLGPTSDAVDVIVGGPPCQAYARVGRAKLREISEHPQAFKVDPRGNLYLRYLDYVNRLKPLAVLIENVPDILNYGGHNVFQEIVEALDAIGYDAAYSLINAAHHGVPQMRDRAFLIGFHRQVGARITFPAASHKCTLPRGYAGTRAVALKLIDRVYPQGFVKPDIGHEDLPSAITAGEAIRDLPILTLHLEGKLKRGARRFTQRLAYRRFATENLSDYALQMRNWPDFEAKDGVYDHVLRYLPRDSPIFEVMPAGTEYPEAHRLALNIFKDKAQRRLLKPQSAEWKKLRAETVPPYDPTKFPNRWWKLHEEKPVRTLTAHIGKDTYSHIHYADDQARVITVREAARLQSFPDGFSFSGTMNPAFRQIGNAVPPVLARQLANAILTSLSAVVRPALAAE